MGGVIVFCNYITYKEGQKPTTITDVKVPQYGVNKDKS